jgi:hypothetical protein
VAKGYAAAESACPTATHHGADPDTEQHSNAHQSHGATPNTISTRNRARQDHDLNVDATNEIAGDTLLGAASGTKAGVEARLLVEDWRIEYNTIRPHSALGYLTPTDYAKAWATKNQPALS